MRWKSRDRQAALRFVLASHRPIFNLLSSFPHLPSSFDALILSCSYKGMVLMKPIRPPAASSEGCLPISPSIASPEMACPCVVLPLHNTSPEISFYTHLPNSVKSKSGAQSFRNAGRRHIETCQSCVFRDLGVLALNARTKATNLRT